MQNIVSTIWTAAAGTTAKEASFGWITAAIGLLGSALGGWDWGIRVLLLAMVIDYGTGVLGAFKQKKINSDVMFWGGVRKGVVLGVIALAAMCDQWIGAEAPVFRNLAIYFYVGREGLSIVENLAPIGVQLPPGLVKFLEQLKQKGEGEGK